MQKQGAKHNKTDRDRKVKQRQTETEAKGAKRKKTDRDRKTKKRQTETEEQGAKRRKTDRDFKSRKRKEMRHQSQNDRRDCNGQDMTNVINRAMKEARQFLHRTRDPANPHKHRAIVCIICDCFIIGTETIYKLTKEDIGKHSGRLGVKSYEEFYQTTLKDEVNSLTPKSVPAGAKKILFGRYVLNIYVGIVRYFLRKTKTRRAKIYLPTQRTNWRISYDIN